MNLYRYSMELDGIRRELTESLSHDEKVVLRSRFEHAHLRDIMQLLDNHHKEIVSYLVATPAKRATLKKWKDPDLRALLTLGAMYYTQHAQVVLSALLDQDILRESTYKQMAVTGAAVFDKIMSGKPWRFPIED